MRKLSHENRNVDHIAGFFDNWIENHPWAHGGWVDGSRPREEVLAAKKPGNDGVTPIQQVRDEILDFTQRLIDIGNISTVLEIGLGECGGTHILWSLLSDEVHTIEPRQSVVDAFISDQAPFPKQSKFHVGKSCDKKIIDDVFSSVDKCDLLFIDGNHLYGPVMNDWINYKSLVRPGGIVAFHDTKMDHPGEREVAKFVRHLEKGVFTGYPIPLIHIFHSLYVGISYYHV